MSSAAAVICALRVDNIHIKLLDSKAICYSNSCFSSTLLVNFIYKIYIGLDKHNFKRKNCKYFY